MKRKRKRSGPGQDVIKDSFYWLKRVKGQRAKKGYKGAHIPTLLMECAMPLAFDSYNMCAMSCCYCFSHISKMSNPTWRGKDIGLQGIDVDKQMKAIKGESNSRYDDAMYEHFYSKKFPLHWGTLTDPFCGFEKQNKFGLRFIEALGEMNYPCVFCFKGRTIMDKEYRKVFERYAKQGNFAFQGTVTIPDDKLARQVEIGAPTTSQRIETLAMLGDMGYWTIARLRPYIIGISDIGIDNMLERLAEAKIRGLTVGYLCVDIRASGNAKLRWDHIGRLIGVKNLLAHYKALSYPQRGAYLRANRLLKEEHSKRLYLFCKKNGILFTNYDQDFKELSMSGNCCALPHTGLNPGLLNWNKNQTSNFLVEARRRYAKTGKRMKFYFSQIFSEDSTYLDDPRLGNEHVGVIGRTTGERAVITLRHILREQWNNLNSGGNPRNFYAGKMLPVGKDTEGNLIYKYNPSEWEGRWAEEGIDLTTDQTERR